MKLLSNKSLFLCIVLLFASLPCNSQTSTTVSKGSFYLSSDETISELTGNWEFYYKKLLEPKDFQSINHNYSPIFIKVPGSWYKSIDTLETHSYGTYRTKVYKSIPPGNYTYQLRFNSVFSSYNLWINGEYKQSVGIVGKSKKTTSPAYKTTECLLNISNTSDSDSIISIEIVLQVSNFHHPRAGILSQVYFGEDDQITKNTRRSTSLLMFVLGIILIIGLTQIVFFVIRPSEISNLYLGILCIIMMLRIISVNERIVASWFPEINWELLFKLDNFSGFGTIPLFGLYLHSLYKNEFPKIFLNIILTLGGIFTIIIFSSRISFYGNFRILFEIYVLLTGLFFLFYVLPMAMKKKRTDSILTFTGFFIIIITAINDVLYSMTIINTGYLASFGLVFFMIIQAFTISKRFAHTVKENFLLSDYLELERKRLVNANSELVEKHILLEEQATRIEEQKEELFSQTEELRVLNEHITSQNEMLNTLNEDISRQKQSVEEKNRDLFTINESLVIKDTALSKMINEMTDSMHYASFIQNSLFPSNEFLKQALGDYFIIWQPLQIVSGDFYWCRMLDKNTVCFCVADCTGHGVPGAMMSVLGISFLNEIVLSADVFPGDYLNQLRDKVIKAISSSDDKMSLSDGMDLLLFTINKETLVLTYSGAFRPLYIIRNKELIVINATRNPIGKYHRNIDFETKKFQLQKDDMIYGFTDGYADQIGGKATIKYKISRFQKLLISISIFPLKEQKAIIKKVHSNWIKDHSSNDTKKFDQTDDILIFGMRI